MNTALVNEILTSRLMIAQQGIDQITDILSDARKNQPVSASSLIAWAENMVGNTSDIDSSVLVLPIIGVMTKYARWDWSGDNLDLIIPGIDDVATVIDLAQNNKKIKGVILLMNTPGGSVQSWIRIEEALRKRVKPCIAVVDGLCASAGMYVASYCDRIIALNATCQVGSIGVMAQLLDSSEAEKNMGLRFIEVYPPESNWKNRSFRDALEGNTDTLIEEELSPLAKHFQDTMRRNRTINEDIEGVLSGRMFYAGDAIKAGLVDDIMTLQDAISLVGTTADERAEITNTIINP